MTNKSFLKECKCTHCKQKLDQINNSRLYWGNLKLNKIQFTISMKNKIQDYINKKFFVFIFNR